MCVCEHVRAPVCVCVCVCMYVCMCIVTQTCIRIYTHMYIISQLRRCTRSDKLHYYTPPHYSLLFPPLLQPQIDDIHSPPISHTPSPDNSLTISESQKNNEKLLREQASGSVRQGIDMVSLRKARKIAITNKAGEDVGAVSRSELPVHAGL